MSADSQSEETIKHYYKKSDEYYKSGHDDLAVICLRHAQSLLLKLPNTRDKFKRLLDLEDRLCRLNNYYLHEKESANDQFGIEAFQQKIRMNRQSCRQYIEYFKTFLRIEYILRKYNLELPFDNNTLAFDDVVDYLSFYLEKRLYSIFSESKDSNFFETIDLWDKIKYYAPYVRALQDIDIHQNVFQSLAYYFEVIRCLYDNYDEVLSLVARELDTEEYKLDAQRDLQRLESFNKDSLALQDQISKEYGEILRTEDGFLSNFSYYLSQEFSQSRNNKDEFGDRPSKN